jgi:hypothetical protein
LITLSFTSSNMANDFISPLVKLAEAGIRALAGSATPTPPAPDKINVPKVGVAAATEPPKTYNPKQNEELNIAQSRVNKGAPGAATATNAGDVANLAYATAHGWTPTGPPTTPDQPAPPTPPAPSGPSGPPEPGKGTSDLTSGLTDALKPPTTGATTDEKKQLSDIQKQISDLSKTAIEDPAAIDARLEETKLAITMKWDNEIRTAQKQAEANRQSRFGQLAHVGVGVNPLSSGYGNISAQVDSDLALVRSNIEAQKAAEIAAASAAARGEKTAAFNQSLAALKEEATQIQTDIENRTKEQQQTFDNTIKSVQTYAQMIKDEKTLSDSESKDAFGKVKDMFTLFGSGAFEKSSTEDIAALERAAGIPFGSIQDAAKTIKEQELEEKKKKDEDAAAAAADKAAQNKQYVPATKYQPAGWFDKTTGQFTPVKGGAGSSGGTASTGGGTSGGASGGSTGSGGGGPYSPPAPKNLTMEQIAQLFTGGLNPESTTGPSGPPTSVPSVAAGTTEAKAASSLQKALPKSNLLGPDGFLAPESYMAIRNEWIKAGYSATNFDTKMKGYVNPNNPNYGITKQPAKKADETGKTVTRETDKYTFYSDGSFVMK